MLSRLLILVLISPFVSGQALTLKFVNQQKIASAYDLSLDQFGNIYYLQGNQIIKKEGSTGAETQNYSDPRLGKISHFTLINPLQPLLYYADFNQIQILDNRLNFSRSIKLLDAGFTDPSLVSYTLQGQILIFDQVSDRLNIYLPESNRIQNFSPAINQLSPSQNRPSLLLTSYNQHLLYLADEGFLVFDALAAYQKKVVYTEKLISADFQNDLLICLSESGLLSLISVKTGQRQELICPQKDIEKIILQNRELYLWQKGSLYHYRLE